VVDYRRAPGRSPFAARSGGGTERRRRRPGSGPVLDVQLRRDNQLADGRRAARPAARCLHRWPGHGRRRRAGQRLRPGRRGRSRPVDRTEMGGHSREPRPRSRDLHGHDLRRDACAGAADLRTECARLLWRQPVDRNRGRSAGDQRPRGADARVRAPRRAEPRQQSVAGRGLGAEALVDSRRRV
jgi:hypothetical protein